MTFSSREYWEQRYAAGSDSGRGSRDRLAEFKAYFVNSFVLTHQIETVVDFGCGDGNIASKFNVPKYVGLDPSQTAIKMCIERCRKDVDKSFFVYPPGVLQDISAELTISLDVIYHLVEDDVFERHMKHLFSSSTRYVIIYSTDRDEITSSPHIRHRNFTDWIEDTLPDWVLTEYVNNKYPDETDADFYVYTRRTSTRLPER